MIIVKLKEAILAYERRTGKKMTYEDLAGVTGIGLGTLQSIGSRPNYHPTWKNVEKLCLALDVALGDLLELVPDRRKKKKKTKAKAKKKTKRGAP